MRLGDDCPVCLERGLRRPAYYPSESPTVQGMVCWDHRYGTGAESERRRERLSHAATERRSQAALRQRDPLLPQASRWSEPTPRRPRRV